MLKVHRWSRTFGTQYLRVPTCGANGMSCASRTQAQEIHEKIAGFHVPVNDPALMRVDNAGLTLPDDVLQRRILDAWYPPCTHLGAQVPGQAFHGLH